MFLKGCYFHECSRHYDFTDWRLNLISPFYYGENLKKKKNIFNFIAVIVIVIICSVYYVLLTKISETIEVYCFSSRHLAIYWIVAPLFFVDFKISSIQYIDLPMLMNKIYFFLCLQCMHIAFIIVYSWV